jgi:hypothetical protein
MCAAQPFFSTWHSFRGLFSSIDACDKKSCLSHPRIFIPYTSYLLYLLFSYLRLKSIVVVVTCYVGKYKIFLWKNLLISFFITKGMYMRIYVAITIALLLIEISCLFIVDEDEKFISYCKALIFRKTILKSRGKFQLLTFEKCFDNLCIYIFHFSP